MQPLRGSVTQVKRMKQIASITAAVTLTIAASAAAQDQLGSAAPAPALRPGWVFTPSVGVSETYDDNITLFGSLEPLNNNDLVSSVGPEASLTYYGRHDRFSTGYGASFLNYRTFSVFDRWNQHAEAEFRRQQNARFEWFGQANGQAVPSTETLEYSGIPFVHTGAVTFDGRGGASYKIDSRNTISSAIQYQHVTFDVQGNAYGRYLRGGWA